MQARQGSSTPPRRHRPGPLPYSRGTPPEAQKDPADLHGAVPCMRQGVPHTQDLFAGLHCSLPGMVLEKGEAPADGARGMVPGVPPVPASMCLAVRAEPGERVALADSSASQSLPYSANRNHLRTNHVVPRIETISESTKEQFVTRSILNWLPSGCHSVAKFCLVVLPHAFC